MPARTDLSSPRLRQRNRNFTGVLPLAPRIVVARLLACTEPTERGLINFPPPHPLELLHFSLQRTPSLYSLQSAHAIGLRRLHIGEAVALCTGIPTICGTSFRGLSIVSVLYCNAWRPPLWSSGQSSWLQIRMPGFDSRHYQKKK
jgi:hypothetical protein